MQQQWRYFWQTIAAIVVSVVFLVLMVVLGAGIQANKEKASCIAAGGHYVWQRFSANECWANGLRIFPEGF